MAKDNLNSPDIAPDGEMFISYGKRPFCKVSLPFAVLIKPVSHYLPHLAHYIGKYARDVHMTEAECNKYMQNPDPEWLNKIRDHVPRTHTQDLGHATR